MEAALLDAAAELLEQEGPEALSVRRIATAAGVAPMGVYNHFDSKFGIVEALFIRGFARLGQAMVESAEVADPMEALRQCGRHYRELALAYPMDYRIMFLRAVPGFEPSDTAVELAAQAFDGLAAAVRRAMAAGQIRPGDPTLTAQMIWATVHGWVSLELSDMGFVDDPEAGFAEHCSTVLQGLAPTTPS
jgi:AcrR family transcriptional regulator